MPSPPRYAPARSLPPYAYIPGQTPHPKNDPRGHSVGESGDSEPCPAPAAWRSCEAYLHGIDLYNHGYPWEAHEAWEGLWRGCGDPVQKNFLQGLIKLCAAKVQDLAGRQGGAQRLAAAALEQLDHVARSLDRDIYMGLELTALLRLPPDSPSSWPVLVLAPS